MHGPHTTPTKYWAFMFRYVLHPLVRVSKWGSGNNVPERPMEQPCFVQSWESESQFSSTPERADLGRLGSVLNRGEAGAERRNGQSGSSSWHSFTKTWKTQRNVIRVNRYISLTDHFGTDSSFLLLINFVYHLFLVCYFIMRLFF